MSYCSGRSLFSQKSNVSTASSARRNALARAAAEKTKSEFQQKIIEKEAELKLLQSKQDTAVAQAELEAIESAIAQEEAAASRNIQPDAVTDRSHRTADWVLRSQCGSEGEYVCRQNQHSVNDALHNSQPVNNSDIHVHAHQDASQTIHNAMRGPPHQSYAVFPSVSAEKQDSSPPIQSVVDINERLAATLARQNLPLCRPDVFNGDATLFYPWRSAFKAMLADAHISPAQELNYLLEFTGGKPRKLIDSFRKRQHANPALILHKAWEELANRFGNTAVITNSLLASLNNAVNFGGTQHGKLQDFADLCEDISCQQVMLPGLACLNYPAIIRPIVDQLPKFLKEKWHKRVVEFSVANNGMYPGFQEFTAVMKEQATLKNHPNIREEQRPFHNAGKEESQFYTYHPSKPGMTKGDPARILKTEITDDYSNVTSCPIHTSNSHTLVDCREFANKSLADRQEVIRAYGCCYRCLGSRHIAKECKAENIKCAKCNSRRHLSLLHRDNNMEIHGEEANLQTHCTTICGDGLGARNCSKIMLADIFPDGQPEKTKRIYVIHDEQSNASLINGDILDEMGITGAKEKYLLTTCHGKRDDCFGRRVSNMVIRSIEGEVFDLPTLVECNQIPEDKREVATSEMVQQHRHLKSLSGKIPQFDAEAKVGLLIGRDAPELLKVRQFINGPNGTPWAHRLLLGWTVIGQMCLNAVGGPVHISSCVTAIQSGVRMSFPCPNQFKVKEHVESLQQTSSTNDLFEITSSDSDIGTSVEDQRFLQTMEESIHKNESGNWEMPLPFRKDNPKMPNNRKQAVSRLHSLLRTLRRKPQIEKDYIEFMDNLVKRGHAVPVPADKLEVAEGKVWYLPHFSVYHPKKPNKIRVVNDASAEFDGVSLNKELLPGPDQMNSLLGILFRFRQHPFAISCDIEQMFYQFFVNKEHRDYLRFLWVNPNSQSREIVEYQMTTHIFGNVSSPAVATFGLRKTADQGEEEFGEASKTFVHKNFYVDDGLTSLPSEEEAITLLKNTQAMLARCNIRLHKIVSNSISVLEAISTEDRASNIQSIDLRKELLPSQRSLGVLWMLSCDSFTFQVDLPDKPFTRRGVLSVVNSIYDPLGFAAPVVIKGKIILQELLHLGKQKEESLQWDDPLPDSVGNEWQWWKNTLSTLQSVEVPRCYYPQNFDYRCVIQTELHAFADASSKAIAAVTYLRLVNEKGDVHVTFLFGQARVVPLKSTTIPRLELCAAVLSTRAVRKILKELDLTIDKVFYYTDSKVVLGYIQNETRRFYVYVANRIRQIRETSEPSQWKYVPSSQNPADVATRSVEAAELKNSVWLHGPQFLKEAGMELSSSTEVYTIDDTNPDVRKEIITKTTLVDSDIQGHATGIDHSSESQAKGTTPESAGLTTERFTRFSKWSILCRAICNLILIARRHKNVGEILQDNHNEDEAPTRTPTIEDFDQATTIIIRSVQKEAYGDIITKQTTGTGKVNKNTSLDDLDPFLDEKGILRVGGRLRRATFPFGEKHPIILPQRHHISNLIASHYHERIHHQGRQITHGAIRQAGYWIIGGHDLVTHVIKNCVTCKKLRGPMATQKMADLPIDRMETSPPFTNVGFDVFGPWDVTTRRLRGGVANSKRWAVVFTCMASRAIHIEIIETMNTDSFICALRRFLAIRGPVKRLRCDRGTNFVGAKEELDKSLRDMNLDRIQDYLTTQRCEWVFNPPHSSHFGGVWERQIATIRRVLEGMMLELGSRQLSPELLVTLMAEVANIVNSRPIATIPSDIDEPQPLSPAMLLTAKPQNLQAPPGNFCPQDVYARKQWRRIQYLSDQFWVRWRREYLQNLQPRRKWKEASPNIEVGDVVILRDTQEHRCVWPLGIISKTVPSDDGMVRKIEVTVIKNGEKKAYLRPVTEVIVIIKKDEGHKK